MGFCLQALIGKGQPLSKKGSIIIKARFMADPLIDRITRFRKIIVFESESRFTLYKSLKEMRALIALGAVLEKHNTEGGPEEITDALDDFTKITIWESSYRFEMNPAHTDVFSQLHDGTCYFITLN
jgi:hypothetical protein